MLLRNMLVAAVASGFLWAPRGIAAETPHLGGTWKPARTFSAALRTVDGKAPQLTVEGQALHQQRRGSARKEDPVRQCLRPGTPRVLFQNRPLMILQTPRKVTFVHEFQHVLRHVYLDEVLPPAEELDPTWGGTAVGRWEGDSLVVETRGFHEGLWLDATGLPQSADARITERIRLASHDRLEILVTIEDPVNYVVPWQARAVYQRADGLSLQEHICAERLLDPVLRRSFLGNK